MKKKNGSFRMDRKFRFGSLKMIIYGRTLIMVLAFLLQFMFLYEGYVALRKYSLLFYAFFVLISGVTVLYIFNRKGSPDMKLSWMLPIAVFPIFGCVVYMTLVLQPGSMIRKKKLDLLAENTGKLLRQNAAQERLRRENPHMGQLAQYLYSCDNSPTYDGTQTKYYPFGDEMFPDMLEAIREAKHFVFLEYFIVEEGEMWDRIHECLLDKVQEGVEVRFLYDGTNALANLPNFYHKLLEKEGIQCRMYAPIKPVFSNHYNNRDHRKLLIVDGKTAFTGGINLADEYINKKKRFGIWKDTGIRLNGKAVDRFTCMFLEMWNAEGKENEDFEAFLKRQSEETPSDGYVIPYSVNPLAKERVGQQVYLDMINTAHTYVHIASPYLIPDHQLLSALCYAARRGVEVVLILPGIPDKKYVFALAKSYYNILLEAGVIIGEYEPGFVHAKMMVADGVKAVIGTVNLDYRSLYHHFECGVVLYRNSLVEEIERDCIEMMDQCVMQNQQLLSEIGLRVRLQGFILRLIAPLM